MADAGGRRRSSGVVELIRLGVVVATTAIGFEIGETLSPAGESPLLGALLGALVGYLAGGVGGRMVVARVDETQERLRRVESAVLVAGGVGGLLATLAVGLLLIPLSLLPGREITVPIALVVLVVAAYAGVRIGATRGGDLGRYLGVRGRIEVASPARGGGAKVVDSSALIDGRVLHVARAGFLEGALVVPRFVLAELQGLADSQDRRRRSAGRRGLDVVAALQQEHLVVVEVTDEDLPEIQSVDAKLAELARRRGGTLVTTDTGLAQVAEIAGTKVLDMRALADAVRPPAVPGQRLEVDLTREGSEDGQAVGYLPDGTMVVVEDAEERVGQRILVEVTSINQTRRGRMLFGVPGVERRRSQEGERRRSQEGEADRPSGSEQRGP